MESDGHLRTFHQMIGEALDKFFRDNPDATIARTEVKWNEDGSASIVINGLVQEKENNV